MALLNNLGGTTPLEMAVLADELVALAARRATSAGMVGPAPLMTSLDMHGFSVSLLPATPDGSRRSAPPVGAAGLAGPAARLAEPEVPPAARRADADPARALAASRDRRALVERCCDALIAAEADLNALDARAGDGDTGTTLAGAARSLKASIPDLPLADLTQLYRAIGIELSQTMGGSSGVLLAIFFAAAGDAAAGGHTMPDALNAGLDRVQEVGGARPGDRTMIDALAPSLAALPQGLSAAAAAARHGADATAGMEKAGAVGRATSPQTAHRPQRSRRRGCGAAVRAPRDDLSAVSCTAPRATDQPRWRRVGAACSLPLWRRGAPRRRANAR